MEGESQLLDYWSAKGLMVFEILDLWPIVLKASFTGLLDGRVIFLFPDAQVVLLLIMLLFFFEAPENVALF